MVADILDAKTPEDIFGSLPDGEEPQAWYKKQYRDLSKLVHPDHCTHPDASAAQARLNELYQEALAGPKVGGVIKVTPKKASYTFSDLLFKAGDLCDLYEGTSVIPGKLVEPAVFKVGRAIGDKDLLEREQAVLRGFWEEIAKDPTIAFFGHTLPRPFGSFTLEGGTGPRPVSVLKKSEGYTGREIRERFPKGVPPEQVAWMLTRLLTTLAMAHKQGQVHGGILPDHLLVRWDDSKGHRHAKVLDWTSSIPMGEKLKVFFPDHLMFYPPEAFNKHPASGATDLFMFGQTANYLLGGDLKARRVPESVPLPLRGAIQSCLIPSLNRRPDDAGDFLFKVFRPALAEIWGSPKYIPFTLPPVPSTPTPT